MRIFKKYMLVHNDSICVTGFSHEIEAITHFLIDDRFVTLREAMDKQDTAFFQRKSIPMDETKGIGYKVLKLRSLSRHQ